MISFSHRATARRIFLIAAPLTLCLLFLFPASADAHAILLRSDPANNAVLSVAPQRVRMWFSEDLNTTFSTALVFDQNNQRVDNGDGGPTANDLSEMDVTLQPNFLPTVYIVVWRSDSADDGHILTGSFIFYVARADGTVPALNPGVHPGTDAFGRENLTGLYTGQLDEPTLFNFVMITLVELGAVLWVGSQLWLRLVLQRSTHADQEQRIINERIHHRFEQRLSPAILLALLLANSGVLLGQALNLSLGQWTSILSFSLLEELIVSSRFGIFWIVREIAIAVALLLALSKVLLKQYRTVNTAGSWTNLFLGSVLFVAIAFSGHASAVSSSILVPAVVVDWLHLLAAALWVGGMMCIAISYLPVLRRLPITEQAYSLITVLPYFSPLAFAGVLIMAISGPLSATFHLTAWNQFLTTAYGRALLVKIVLVGALLVTSALHVGLLRPRLRKEYQKYTYVKQRLQSLAPIHVGVQPLEQGTGQEGHSLRTEEKPSRAIRWLAHQVRLREQRLTKKTQRLTKILRWEPIVGVGVLVCVGLMNAFAGTLSPITQAQTPPYGSIPPTIKPFHTTVKTTDGQLILMLDLNPKRLGPNVLTISIIDNSARTLTTDVRVVLSISMLDMDMGTDTLNVQPDGKGHFSINLYLGMQGNWQLRIQVHTPDDKPHEVKVHFFVPF